MPLKGKKFVIIVAWSLCIFISIFQLLNAGKYFSQHSTDLIYVFAIALAGGIAFYVYSGISPDLQREFILISLGVIAIIMSGGSIWSLIVIVQLFQLFQSSPNGTPSEIVALLLVMLFLLILGTIYCWLRFSVMLGKHHGKIENAHNNQI